MNIRIFRTEDERRESLYGAILQSVGETLAPHVGLISDHDRGAWLLDRFATAKESIRLVGYPESLADEIVSRHGIRHAAPADLLEPLDVVVLIDHGPAALPDWFQDARAIFVAPSGREQLDQWTEAAEKSGVWFFVVANDYDDDPDMTFLEDRST